MAKAEPKKTAKPATKAVKAGHSPAAAKTTKVVKAAAPVKKPAAAKAVVISKDELRAQLEKAQNTIATLRTKSREAVRAAKASAAQIAELEVKVAQLEKKLTAQAKPAKSDTAVVKPVKQRGRKSAEKADVDVPAESDDLALVEAETPSED
jgi:nucleoside-triphosphatase THEP1